MGVGDDVAETDLTVQVRFVAPFDACLARVRRARVARGVESLQILCAQSAHVAHRVRHFGPIRVMANQARLEVDTREARTLDGEIRDFLVRQSELQRDGLEAGTAAAQFHIARNICGIDELQGREAMQGIVNVVDELGNEFELVGRQVFGNDAPFPVEDQPADRRRRYDAHAVALRLFGKQLVIDDLQLHQSCDDEAEQQQRDDGCEDDAPQEQAPLRMDVLDRR